MKTLPQPLSGSPLVRDYLAGREPARSFYGSAPPSSPEAYREKAREVEAKFPHGGRARLAEALHGGGPDAESRLDRFVREEGFAVTTGQQPGLLGGPLYTLYKALSAAALARRLEAIVRRPVLPVFWVASQDHDWDEVRRTYLPDLTNEWTTVELQLPEGMPPHPFHGPRLGTALDSARRRLLSVLPDSDFAQPYRSLLSRSHSGDRSLAEAEAFLLAELLAEAGVHILRPEAPELSRAALPTLLAEAGEAEAREGALLRRGEELREAGYDLQVPLLDGGVNLFFETAHGRERLFVDGPNRFRTRRSNLGLDRAELERRGEADPARLTPNVLLRPVVETVLVPTLAYVAGPGEAAYFPQTVPLFRAAGRTPPVVHPRLSALILESKVEKVLEKFGLEPEALRRPHHELAGELTREEFPPPLRAALGGLRGDIAKGSRSLASEVAPLDPTLKGAVESFRRQGFGLLDDVEKKITQALKRENEIALAQLEKAQLHLFPEGRPQERMFSPFYYLFRYGPGLLREWARIAEASLELSPDVPAPTSPGDAV